MNRMSAKRKPIAEEWYIVQWTQCSSLKLGIFRACSLAEIEHRIGHMVNPVTVRATKEDALKYAEELIHSFMQIESIDT
ncbi:hypothetical protein LSG31_14055 [Fodinisporobacter ferrooxydans]|uniref:Uncharacterized protein n=1 Tax=Fodinisporobacter ferrooxydans TaxID=2901836 RepID=A0ABY4CHY1_9BACL|nr:hypothetical protein LSG31_14055 [Alicyclobacillaceae bacterium MYW30-H2]